MICTLFLVASSAFLFLPSGEAVQGEITVTNNCDYSVYVKTQNANTGNFQLSPNGGQNVWTIPGTTDNTLPKPRLAGYTGCDGDGNNCDQSDSTGVGLAEFLFQDYGDQDWRGYTWYDLSFVDGFNIPMSMAPYATDNNGGNCYQVQCNYDLNSCPGESQVTNGNGQIVSCQTTNKDDGSTSYAQGIKNACPTVYSWSHDDTAGQRACRPGNDGLTINFCS